MCPLEAGVSIGPGMAKRRRRWEEELEREPEHSGKRQLARLDAAARAGVLEELQRAGGNRAVQQVVAGAQLQRDVATEARPATSPKAQWFTGEWALSLDGTVVGRVRSVEGGSVRSDVITESGSGQVAHKHIGAPQYDPFVLEVGLGMSKGFFDWIGGAFDRKYSRKSLILHQTDRATGQEMAQLELKQALVTAVEVPQLAAADTNPGWLKITIAPETVRRSAGTGVKLDAKLASDPLSPSTIRFEVSGIGRVSELKSVAPWTFKQTLKGMAFGRARDYEQEPAKTEFGNLLVTLAEGAKGAGSGISGFDAWAHDFIIEGNTGNENERTAVLTVSSQGGRKLELSFSGVGIFAADQLARSEAGGRRYGLYVERAALRIP